MPITKSEAASRLMDLVQRFKQVNCSIVPYFIEQELKDIEKMIVSMEDSIAEMIDQHMAYKYEYHNLTGIRRGRDKNISTNFIRKRFVLDE